MLFFMHSVFSSSIIIACPVSETGKIVQTNIVKIKGPKFLQECPSTYSHRRRKRGGQGGPGPPPII